LLPKNTKVRYTEL